MVPVGSPSVGIGMAAGLADPVHGSQAVFRAVMRALAQPGSIETINVDLDPPAPLTVAAAAVCLTLADFETPLWLAPSLRETAATGDYLRFHTDAMLVAAASAAAFAIVDLRRDPLDLADFVQGTAEYPDRGATVILLCDRLDATDPLTLAGPGIRGTSALGAGPLPQDFAAQWARNHAAFPLGVDVILTAGRQLAALPRSTRILAEAA